MKCPLCSNQLGVEIDMHSDGYADNLLECAVCETIWMETPEGATLLNKKVA